MDDISINKYISDTGFCSRREADKLIEQLRVEINDSVALKGNRVKEGDIVFVDGEKIKQDKKTVYIALYKPRGIVTTTDTLEKNNIISYINYKQRIFPVGRLDKQSEGLIIMTNNGDIVNKILRAGNTHEKEYIVTVDKEITQDFLHRMRNGLSIDGKMTKNCTVLQMGKNKFKIILVQGLYRQIRKMCEVCGYHVTQLIRTRVMHLTTKDLPNGKWRYLTPAEITEMESLLKNSSAAPKKKKAKKPTQPKMDIEGEETDRPAKPKQFGKKPMFAKTEKPKEAEKTNKYDKSVRAVKSRKTERADKTVKLDKFEKHGKPTKADRADKPEKFDKTIKTGKPAKFDKFAKAGRSDKPIKFEKPKKGGKPTSFEKGTKGSKPTKGSGAKRPPGRVPKSRR